MNETELKALWEQEEKIAHIHGWDFSHIDGRCVETELPWDYKDTIEKYITKELRILDYDTGGGEFLLSLKHPYEKTAATEGYAPNVELCQSTLLPLGIDFKACDDPANIPFPDESFDLILNRHGDFVPKELHRLLKKGGMFITQQVGADNDRDLVEMVLPGLERPFPHCTLKEQSKAMEDVGFRILEGKEAYRPMRFYDVGAFVWFARIIQWEFPDFSVEKCWDRLLEMEKKIRKDNFVEGTVHRWLMVAQKQ